MTPPIPALALTPYERANVLLLGQDPCHDQCRASAFPLSHSLTAA